VSVPAAPTEAGPAQGTAPAPVIVLAPAGMPRRTGRGAWPGGLAGGMWLGALAIAGVVCWATFYAKGGLNLESMTTSEIAVTLAAGLVSAAALLAGARGRPLYGLGTLALLIAFAALTTISVVWSVQPDSSWHDAGRMLAYSGVFAAALALARLAPERWPALLGGLTLAAVIVCGYALATKVFPAGLAPANAYARLEEPFGYWNAIGLAAAMGAICCMWLGSRRSGHALLSALAYPAMGLLLLTLTLAYSRGALAAFAIGLLAWFCLVPLRLRGAAVLIIGALGAGAVAAWDFSTHALSSEKVPLAERVGAGHELGALTLAMLLVLAMIGLAIGFATSRRAPSLTLRRQAGAALLALIVLAVLAFAGALAHSHRGFGGSISHAFDALTNPNAKPPSNTPDRLTAVASVRARYWKEALQVFEAHPLLGSGAEGYATAHLRYRTETLSVRHAHGFIVQTLADLGLLGLVLALALLLAWLTAAARSTHPFNRRWVLSPPWRAASREERPGWRPLRGQLRRYPPERIGMLSLLCVVIVFGMHSLIDWTWYVPGNAYVALLCAGWLAGRGPLRAGAAPVASRASELGRGRLDPSSGRWAGWARRVGPVRAGLAAVAILLALMAAWSQWQPQRSEEARQQALDLLASSPAAANAAARRAVSRDPLSVEALFTLADVQSVGGKPIAARATLQKAVRLQPSNPKSWLELGRFDLAAHRPQAALSELKAAIYLNPESIAPEEITGPGAQREGVEIYNDYIQALRATSSATALKNANARRARGAARARRGARRRSARTRSQNRSPRAGG
jgi:O-antigen ligase/Tfp pilus assembly protein PilF